MFLRLSAKALAMLCLILLGTSGGCCHGLIVSQRFYDQQNSLDQSDPLAMAAIRDAQAGDGEPLFIQHANRLFAKIGITSCDEGEGTNGADTFAAPIAKFHPVPTRPVFSRQPN